MPGQGLDRLLGVRKLELEYVLRVSASLSDTLGALHERNITHGGVHPSNVFVDLARGTVKLAGSGIERELKGGLTAMDATYLSPEELGRMNRWPDYRSDLYSLGALLYVMLTGSPPFQSDDLLTLIHRQVARTPPPPEERNTAVPAVLSRIVLRLLAKAPEERYQSDVALHSDLRECLRRLDTGGIEPFEIARGDVPQRFHAPQTLAGRDAEAATLAAVFERVRAGAREMVTLRGPAGIGKTALAWGLQTVVRGAGCRFASAKLDHLAPEHPYGALALALDSVFSEILASGSEAVLKVRTELVRGLGPNGRVATDLVPCLEHIIGPQPAAPDTSPQNVQNRLRFVLGLLVEVACADAPLVLFLDDLQWADPASLHLGAQIVAMPELRNLLVLCAYRDTDVGPDHPVSLAIEATREAVPVTEIVLPPLSVDGVTALLSQALRRTRGSTRSLAGLVHGKTQGNPFYVCEFVRMLFDARLLRLEQDPSGGPAATAWSWSAEDIARLPVAENVTDIVTARVAGLPPQTVELLRVAACAGSRTDIDVIARVLGIPLEQALTRLADAVREGVVEQAEGTYRFIHDRIPEHLYARISVDERAGLHYRIGCAMRQTAANDPPEEIAAEIADHLNRAVALIGDPAERRNLAGLNHRAGLRAKRLGAFQSAYQYFRSGIDCLGSETWLDSYDLCLSLHNEGAEAGHLCGDEEGMRGLAEVVLTNARNETDKLKVYGLQIAAAKQRNPLEATNLWAQVQRAYGIRYPANPTKIHVAVEYVKFKTALKRIDLGTYLKTPRNTEHPMVEVLRLTRVAGDALLMAKPALFGLAMVKSMNLGHRHRIVNESTPLSFMGYSIMLAGVLGDTEEAQRIGDLALSAAMGTAGAFQTEVLFLYLSFVNHWKRHLASSLPRYLEAHRIGVRSGEFSFASHSLVSYCFHSLNTGRPLDALLGDVTSCTTSVRALREESALDHLEIARVSVLRLSTDGVAPEGTLPERLAGKKDRYGLFLYHLYLAIHLSLQEDTPGAVSAMGNAALYVESAMGLAYLPVFNFRESLVLMDSLRASPRRDRTPLLGRVLANQRRMERWARHGPMNCRHRYDLVAAELCSMRGDVRRAEALYESAIRGAHENGYVNEEAEARERSARFYQARGLEGIAASLLREAWSCYATWGARAVVRRLERGHPGLLRPDTGHAGAHTGGASTAAEHMDLGTVLKASEALAGEMDLDRLLDKILQIAMENVGARRGALILERSGALYVEVTGSVDTAIAARHPARLEECAGVAPLSIVRYVYRTGQSIIVDDARVNARFGADPDVARRGVRSVLCVAIRHKGRIAGVAYLENDLSTHAFTPQRLDLATMLASQAAVSLENARLYGDLKAEKEREAETMTRAIQTRDAELRTRRLELELLKKTIQPHFLFNTLTAIRGWLLERPAKSLDLIDALGEEVRALVDVSDRTLISLDKEVELCRTHLAVMGLRLDRKYDLDVDGTTGAETIPPLVFHTMVENAFTHADARLFSRFRLVKTSTPVETRYTFTVDSRGAADVREREGTGMKYIRARLEESYSGRYSIRCAQLEDAWTATIGIREPPA